MHLSIVRRQGRPEWQNLNLSAHRQLRAKRGSRDRAISRGAQPMSPFCQGKGLKKPLSWEPLFWTIGMRELFRVRGHDDGPCARCSTWRAHLSLWSVGSCSSYISLRCLSSRSIGVRNRRCPRRVVWHDSPLKICCLYEERSQGPVPKARLDRYWRENTCPAC